MSALPNEDCFIFVIDTEQYSGNFERQLSSYITAIYDDNGYPEYATLFLNDMKINPKTNPNPFKNIVKAIPSEYGEVTCSIWPTPGWGNDGHGDHKELRTIMAKKKYTYPSYQSVAIFLNTRPSDELITLMKERAIKFSNDPKTRIHTIEKITIFKFRLIEYKITRTEIETVL